MAGDTNGASDVFVHDRQTGETRRVSVASDGTQGNSQSNEPSPSADGRYVAFSSVSSTLVADDTNGTYDVFVHDRQTGETQRVSVSSNGAQGKLESHQPSLSAGRSNVAFIVVATTLVAGDTTGTRDVFVHDRQDRRDAARQCGQRRHSGERVQRHDGECHHRAALAERRRALRAFSSLASTLVAGD